ncbi:hypothetical protein D3C75_1175870 [compost metagenome]
MLVSHQTSVQLIKPYGFDQAFIHPRFNTQPNLFGLRIGSQANDHCGRHSPLKLSLANGTGQVDTVHDGHMAVCDDDIKCLLLPACKGFLAILCLPDIMTEETQLLMKHLAIDPVIIDHQHL